MKHGSLGVWEYGGLYFMSFSHTSIHPHSHTLRYLKEKQDDRNL